MKVLSFLILTLLSSEVFAGSCPVVGGRSEGNWEGCNCREKKEAMVEWAVCHLMKPIVNEFSGGWFSDDKPEACHGHDYKYLHARAVNWALTNYVPDYSFKILVGINQGDMCTNTGQNLTDFRYIWVPLDKVNCVRGRERVTEYKRCRANWE